MQSPRSDGRDPMHDTVVIVPLRSLRRGKKRLGQALSEEDRANLIERMARTVVTAANGLPVIVVHDDAEVGPWAEELGALPLAGVRPGLNNAVEEGRAHARQLGYRRCIIAHADLPHARDFTPLARARCRARHRHRPPRRSPDPRPDTPGGTMTTDLPVPERALAIAAHPDDIEFECGATLAKWAAAGCEVHHLVCTDGSKGTWDANADTVALVDIRKEEQREAARRLGATGEVWFLDQVDGELTAELAVRREVARVIRMTRPTVVFGHDPWKRWRLHPDPTSCSRTGARDERRITASGEPQRGSRASAPGSRLRRQNAKNPGPEPWVPCRLLRSAQWPIFMPTQGA